jgi:hypothetical protein
MNPRGLFPIVAFFLTGLIPAVASAADSGEIFPTQPWAFYGSVAVDGATVEPRSQRIWHVRFEAPAAAAPLVVQSPPPSPEATAGAEQRPTAIEYSDFYNLRRKIHMVASYATIPLFVGEYLAGQKLYDGNGSESAKSAHGALTAGLAGLFAVNTVTGVWNLWDARKDPNGRTRRIVHSLLMLGADAGFVATAGLAPDDDDGGFTGDRSAHRNAAIASMGVAAASYIYMLVTR